MPASIQINTRDIERAMRRLDDQARKHIPFATALALTRTGQALKKDLGQHLAKTFDNPSRYITAGTFSTSATKSNLSVTVGMRDQAPRGASPAQYVQESFAGGARGMKPYELAMQSIGALPPGMRAVPAAGIKLDRSGGPNRAQLAEIFGALKRGTRVFAGRGKRASEQGYFIVTPQRNAKTQHLEPGLYRRIKRGRDSNVVPVFLFVAEATYRKVINLPDLAQKTVSREFSNQFNAALNRATETAR